MKLSKLGAHGQCVNKYTTLSPLYQFNGVQSTFISILLNSCIRLFANIKVGCYRVPLKPEDCSHLKHSFLFEIL